MPRTYSEMYIALRNRLRDAGIEAAALEARLIAATAAGKSTEKLLRDMRYYATDEVERRAEEMVQRRLAGEPVAYITGVWEFRGLPMEVSRDVLIPRIDTEVLAERGILKAKAAGEGGRVLAEEGLGQEIGRFLERQAGFSGKEISMGQTAARKGTRQDFQGDGLGFAEIIDESHRHRSLFSTASQQASIT